MKLLLNLFFILNILQFNNSLGISDKEKWLKYTNEYRKLHNVPLVRWSDCIEKSAQEYVNTLTSLRHSNSYYEKPPYGPAGENLAMGHKNIKSVVDSWYSEIKCCSKFPGCKPKKCTIGHFTAIVWKGVKEIGCAINKKRRIYICRYKSDDVLNGNTVNMRNFYEKNVFKPNDINSKKINKFKNC